MPTTYKKQTTLILSDAYTGVVLFHGLLLTDDYELAMKRALRMHWGKGHVFKRDVPKTLWDKLLPDHVWRGAIYRRPAYAKKRYTEPATGKIVAVFTTEYVAPETQRKLMEKQKLDNHNKYLRRKMRESEREEDIDSRW